MIVLACIYQVDRFQQYTSVDLIVIMCNTEANLESIFYINKKKSQFCNN